MSRNKGIKVYKQNYPKATGIFYNTGVIQETII